MKCLGMRTVFLRLGSQTISKRYAVPRVSLSRGPETIQSEVVASVQVLIRNFKGKLAEPLATAAMSEGRGQKAQRSDWRTI
jgi:hypothetical protein